MSVTGTGRVWADRAQSLPVTETNIFVTENVRKTIQNI